MAQTYTRVSVRIRAGLVFAGAAALIAVAYLHFGASSELIHLGTRHGTKEGVEVLEFFLGIVGSLFLAAGFVPRW